MNKFWENFFKNLIDPEIGKSLLSKYGKELLKHDGKSVINKSNPAWEEGI